MTVTAARSETTFVHVILLVTGVATTITKIGEVIGAVARLAAQVLVTTQQSETSDEMMIER